jgi:hypothetical protein
MPTLADLLADMAVSRAQLASGDLVSADDIYAEEQAALDELDTKRSVRPHREATNRL